MSTAIAHPPVAKQSSQEELWPSALYLNCTVSIELAAPGFTVRDLLRLEPGSIVASSFKHAANVPLTVNGLVLAWVEFEVLGNNLGARVMELL